MEGHHGVKLPGVLRGGKKKGRISWPVKTLSRVQRASYTEDRGQSGVRRQGKKRNTSRVGIRPPSKGREPGKGLGPRPESPEIKASSRCQDKEIQGLVQASQKLQVQKKKRQNVITKAPEKGHT